MHLLSLRGGCLKGDMPEALLTQFDRDDDLLNVFWRAMYYDTENKEAEWPGNILSKKTVIYADGTISRVGAPVKFAVHPEELELARRLAKEAAKVMEGVEFMGGSGQCFLEPFYNTAQDGAAVPARLDPDLIRARFAGTIYAGAEIFVEPMTEETPWFKRLASLFNEKEEEDLKILNRWREMLRWFRAQPDFVDSAFVRIGDNLEGNLDDPPEEDSEYYGVVMPRVAIGLTKAGSLAGVGGFVVRA